MEEIENRVKNLSIYKPPLKKRKIEEEDKMEVEEDKMKEIENKIEVLSLKEKPKYKLNKAQEKILEYIEKNIDSNEIITISGIAGAGKTFTILHIFDKLHELTKNKNICFCAPTNNVVERCKKYKTELEKHF